MGILGTATIDWDRAPRRRELTLGTSLHRRLLDNLVSSEVLNEVNVGDSLATTRQFWLPKGDGRHRHLGEHKVEVNGCLRNTNQEMPTATFMWMKALEGNPEKGTRRISGS
eukprot:GHVN01050111.1.p1 GENE.GHVN01050111.1~~GHVN01050111.1.p1  ORF type:complete len:111 (+),score=20.44 GHVN01050111.1:222-554(+)